MRGTRPYLRGERPKSCMDPLATGQTSVQALRDQRVCFVVIREVRIAAIQLRNGRSRGCSFVPKRPLASIRSATNPSSTCSVIRWAQSSSVGAGRRLSVVDGESVICHELADPLEARNEAPGWGSAGQVGGGLHAVQNSL